MLSSPHNGDAPIALMVGAEGIGFTITTAGAEGAETQPFSSEFITV